MILFLLLCVCALDYQHTGQERVKLRGHLLAVESKCPKGVRVLFVFLFVFKWKGFGEVVEGDWSFNGKFKEGHPETQETWLQKHWKIHCLNFPVSGYKTNGNTSIMMPACITNQLWVQVARLTRAICKNDGVQCVILLFMLQWIWLDWLQTTWSH